MAFKGITFAGQNVTPKNDGGLYQAHHGDGILWGCSMAISGDDLVIQSGEFIAGGRVCFVDGATSVNLSDRTITAGYIQVVMDFDMSQAEGSQWTIHRPLIENPSSPSFGALTQDNINGTGTLYQVELAIVQVSGSGLSIYATLGNSRIVQRDIDGDGTLSAGIGEGGGSVVVSDADGDTVGGVSAFWSGGTATSVYGDGRYIRLQPNGVTNQISQFSVYTNGTAGMSGTDPSYGEARLSVDASGGGFIKVDGSGNRQGGSSVFDAGGVALYDESGTGVYLRPNGVGSTNGQLFVADNGNVHITGQQIGGHLVYTGTQKVNTVASGAQAVVNEITGLDAQGTYLILAYFSGAVSSGDPGWTDVSIQLGNVTEVGEDLYSNNTGRRKCTLSCYCTGKTSVQLHIWASSAYSFSSLATMLRAIRLG